MSEGQTNEEEERGGWGEEGKMKGDRLKEMKWEESEQNTLWTLSRGNNLRTLIQGGKFKRTETEETGWKEHI